MAVATIDRLPNPASQLPHELAVQVGCVGCEGAGCGTYSVSESDREARKALVQDLRTAQELAGIPLKILSGGTTREYGQAEQNCDPENCSGDQTGLIKDILSEG